MLNNKGLTPLEKTIDKVGGRYTTNADRGLMSPSAYLVGENSVTGLTLVEVLIATLITLILFLALMQSALLSIDSNMINVLRDEAVRIAESRMKELRGLPFGSPTLEAVGPVVEGDTTRNFRNFSRPFTLTREITDIGGIPPTVKQIDVSITWGWKEKTVANGNPYTYLISSLKRNPIP